MASKQHNGKNVVRFDRNRAASTQWVPLQRMPVDPEGAAQGVVAAFANHKYAVYVKQTTSSGFVMMGPDGRPSAAPVMHMIIVRRDGRPPEWKHLQRIKNEIAGPTAEACEIFPSEDRRVDAPQTHLWCLPPGMRIPLGLEPKGAEPHPDDEIVPGVVRRSDLQFYVVETPQGEGAAPIVEVFADERDAQASYEAAGTEFPTTGGLRMFGEVPVEEEGAAWSVNAIARRDEVRERLNVAAQADLERRQAMVEAIQLPDGPSGLEEELEAAGMWDGPLDEGPPSVLEGEMLAEAMEAGMQRMEADRAAAAAEAAVSPTPEEAEAEEAATADLRAMRDQLVRTGRLDGGSKPN
ncbi:MAG: hypothetical protein WC683_01215 [bacterium]